MCSVSRGGVESHLGPTCEGADGSNQKLDDQIVLENGTRVLPVLPQGMNALITVAFFDKNSTLVKISWDLMDGTKTVSGRCSAWVSVNETKVCGTAGNLSVEVSGPRQ